MLPRPLWSPFCLLLLFASAACAQDSADARIRYYRERLGGRGTYPIYARLGLAYAQRARETGRVRDYDHAARYLRRSLAFQPNYEAISGMAAVSLARHEFPEALAFAQQAADTLPSDPEAQGALFDAQLALGNHEKAAAILEASLGRNQNFAMLTRLANLREYRGDTAGALVAVEKACAQAESEGLPPSTRAWCAVRTGSLLVLRCEAEKAEAEYQRALVLFPGYYLAREHLAELWAAQGKRNKAITLYRELLRTVAEPVSRLALADLYELEGRARPAALQRKQAMAELEAAARRGSRAHLREFVLLLSEEPDLAAKAVRWAEQDWKNRRDLYAADALAWAYFHSGRLREAESSLEQELAPGGAPPSTLLRAVRIKLALGHREQARALLGRALACPLALTPGERSLAEELRAQLQAEPAPR